MKRPPPVDSVERQALERGEHAEPHRILGAHAVEGGIVIRAFHPDARSCDAVLVTGVVPLAREGKAGLFSALLEGAVMPARHHLRFAFADGATWELADPYSFLPTLGQVDEHLIAEGTHRRIWERLGSRPLSVDGVQGSAFAVWAPNARGVSVLGDFCQWDARLLPMRKLGTSGIFELFVPGAWEGAHYRYAVKGADGKLRLKADPCARWTERSPGNASRIFQSRHAWNDGEWMRRRRDRDWTREPVSFYEVHPGSWRRGEGGRTLTWHEMAPQLADHVARLGFTHVELMSVAEHPFDGSWGYQISGYFAPTSRFGDPDDFRAFIDHLHQRGIGVVLDWVPAHFVKDEWALSRFDGTALYEHADPRRGEHPDWGTHVFNLSRHEVRSFLLGNAMYWLEEFHVDGLRVDAVASMLYLDYSRNPGEWVPNAKGGREDLDAVSFLREFNRLVRDEHPGCFTVAEESTSWHGVTAPVERGGLGFTFKWNLGWMHDTLEYFATDAVFRKHHHERLTFAMLYENTERFVNALSHDEVVHGKRSLIGRMPGDDWQRMANLRTLFAYQWTRPGKKLLFMGSEMAPEFEWNHDVELPWAASGHAPRAALMHFLAELGRVYREREALWKGDPDPHGFQWIDCADREQSVLSYLRRGGGDEVLVVLNLTPVPRFGYRIGTPHGGWHVVLLDSDAPVFGGSGCAGRPGYQPEHVPWQGFPRSLMLDLPPLSALILHPHR